MVDTSYSNSSLPGFDAFRFRSTGEEHLAGSTMTAKRSELRPLEIDLGKARETAERLGRELAAANIVDPRPVDSKLALDPWLTFLRLAGDGKVAVLAHLPQDVTHVRVEVKRPGGATTSMVIPKGDDFAAKKLLGKLAAGTKVTITAIHDDGTPGAERRGPPFELTWNPKAKAPEDVRAYVGATVRASGDTAEIKKTIESALEGFAKWTTNDHLFFWSDAGTKLRHALLGKLDELAKTHPDLEIKAGADIPARKIGELARMSHQAEKDWADQVAGIT